MSNINRVNKKLIEKRTWFFCAFLLGFAPQAYSDDPLPKLNIDLNHITVSGFSSGGYMANQFHLAHADKINAVGIIGAGPYYCSEGSLTTLEKQCTDGKEVSPSVQTSIAKAQENAKADKIANLDNLKNAIVWIFHGDNDNVIVKPVTDALVDFYKAFVPEKNITYVTNVPAGHGIPTEDYGLDCSASETPYINNCQYDAVGHMFKAFYGQLKKPSNTDRELISFDQTSYTVQGAGLGKTGYLYVPQRCMAGEPCKLHVSFHGCFQNAPKVGDAYTKHAGFNPWAEANNLVILYPQTSIIPTQDSYSSCWDWWGFRDKEHFAERDGNQIKSVWNMILALQGDPTKTKKENSTQTKKGSALNLD